MADEEECCRPFTRGKCTCEQCKDKSCTHARCKLEREERGLGQPRPGCCCRAIFDATVRTYADMQSKLCWNCAEAIKGPHGYRCCQWVWPEQGQAFRTHVVMAHEAKPTPLLQQTSERPSAEQTAEREQELSRRLLWCIENGFAPANAHVWRAPATGEQDQRMGALGLPWHADGSLRVEGVPWGSPSVGAAAGCAAGCAGLETPKTQQQSQPQSWTCRKCACHVPHPPRAFVGGPEPLWWWWCGECRRNKPAESVRSKRQRLAAAGSADIRKSLFKGV